MKQLTLTVEQYKKLQKDVDEFYVDVINSGQCEHILAPIEEMEVNEENQTVDVTISDTVDNLEGFDRFLEFEV